jgi:hypothetical protein
MNGQEIYKMVKRDYWKDRKAQDWDHMDDLYSVDPIVEAEQ